MKKLLFTIILFICTVNMSTHSQGSVEVNRYGKRIQLDGFLMEWSGKTAHKWDSAGIWYWDAINTPEGISGYIRSEKSVACTSWTFIIETSGSIKPLVITIPPESLKNEYYSIDNELYGTSSKVSVEWIVPWSRAELDAGKRYALDLRGRSGCGDLLPSLILNGSKIRPRGIITPGLIAQVTVIIVLLLIYFIAHNKIRSQNRRKRWPRPEA